MNNPEPSPSPDYDIHELFREELGSDEVIAEDAGEPAYSLQDEDRLYTDEFMRQNEQASRFLLLSVIGAGLISIGIGGWYLFSQNRSQPQQNVPLQVPEQPPVTPLPSFNNSPSLPNMPSAPGQKLPPTDSGIIPNTLPSGNSTLPPQVSPNIPGAVTTPPPPPPETP
jgi:hypothetical protein